MTHFITMCNECGTVIAQCRCPSLFKEVTYQTCDACRQLNEEKLAPFAYDDQDGNSVRIERDGSQISWQNKDGVIKYEQVGGTETFKSVLVDLMNIIDNYRHSWARLNHSRQ